MYLLTLRSITSFIRTYEASFEEFNLQRLKNLVYLDLRSNGLTMLSESIGALKKLEIFNLYSNNLQELPLSIGDLTELIGLDIGNNPKLKQLPATFGNLTKLRKLIMVNTQIPIESLPASLSERQDADLLEIISGHEEAHWGSSRLSGLD